MKTAEVVRVEQQRELFKHLHRQIRSASINILSACDLPVSNKTAGSRILDWLDAYLPPLAPRLLLFAKPKPLDQVCYRTNIKEDGEEREVILATDVFASGSIPFDEIAIQLKGEKDIFYVLKNRVVFGKGKTGFGFRYGEREPAIEELERYWEAIESIVGNSGDESNGGKKALVAVPAPVRRLSLAIG